MQEIRKATMQDVTAIQELVNSFADNGIMLGLSRSLIYDRLRDFWVALEDDQVVGVGALHFCWENLGEVRSVAVKKDCQTTGVGKRIVETLLDEARRFNCKRIFTLTYVPEFFRKLGFSEIDKGELPHKIWADCINCPKFPDCNETAMAFEMEEVK